MAIYTVSGEDVELIAVNDENKTVRVIHLDNEERDIPVSILRASGGQNEIDRELNRLRQQS